jgi:hypothetical protein
MFSFVAIFCGFMSFVAANQFFYQGASADMVDEGIGFLLFGGAIFLLGIWHAFDGFRRFRGRKIIEPPSAPRPPR